MEESNTYTAATGGGRQNVKEDPALWGGGSGKQATGGAGVSSLPSIPVALQHRGARTVAGVLRNPLSLVASDSRATAAHTAAQKNWRSALLEYEVAMKELTANDIEAPPSALRLMKTFQLYDAVLLVVADHSPELADMLRMFRLEFCRATFTQQHFNIDLVLGQDYDEPRNGETDELAVTYFDEVDVLRRENAALRLEVTLGNTRDNLAYMSKQIAQLTEINSYYENEVTRLERENARAVESYRKAREEFNQQKKENSLLSAKYDEERQQLLQENKDMQLRLYRLQKHLGYQESVVVKDAYKYMKEKKMSLMTRLFDEGDERVSILVILSQLETRVNEELDEYDKEMLLCDESDLPTCQVRMVDVVSVLLEEMHLCEERYLRLVPDVNSFVWGDRDETDAYVSLLSQPRLYAALVARLTNSGKLDAAESEFFLEASELSEEEKETKEILEVAPKEVEFGSQTAVSELSKSGFTYRSILQEPVDEKGEDVKNVSEMNSVNLSRKTLQDEAELEKVKPEQQEVGEEKVKQSFVTTVEKSFLRRAYSSGRLIRKISKEALELVKNKQKKWVDNIFGTVVETEDLLKRSRKQSGLEGHITDDERIMNYVISKPMLDVSSNKFQSGIDIFTGPSPLTQSFLCSVMHVDPTDPLHVPQGTNFLHIKYRNPLRIEAVEEDPNKAATIAPGAEALEEWGGKTCYVPEVTNTDIPGLVNNGTVFKELRHQSMQKDIASAGVIVSSSSTPSTARIERLNPLSPNRSPEWLLYQNMFGGYRPLAPRLIDISYINHILLNACERHFDRFEERYMYSIKSVRGRATNSQMAQNMAERVFKESYVLTDFQESIISELEARYCYPELVAKTLYELLCFLDAMKSQPLVDLYLSCIRGFESPTRIHYITYVLYQLGVNWPSSNPEEAVLKEDVFTLLEHIYKRASAVTGVDPNEILTEYQMATRSGPITLTSLRNYLVTMMLHFEDPLLLYYNGLLSYKATSSSVVEMSFDTFEFVIKGKWKEKIEGKLLVRYLTASCGFNKKTDLTTKELACVAASIWSSDLWAY